MRPVRSSYDRLAAVMDWALEQLGDAITIEDLASRANVTTRTLNRHFHARVGTNPLNWLQTQRTQRAQELLEEGDEPIEAIARRCGFGTPEALRRALPPGAAHHPRPPTAGCSATTPPGPSPVCGGDLRSGCRAVAEFPEEGSYVSDQHVWLFHGGKVAAAVELSPLDDDIRPLCNVPQRDEVLLGEDGQRSWRGRRLGWCTPLVCM
jgi:AraC-like DNA-binding protein